MKRFRYWNSRIALTLNVACAVYHGWSGNYSAAIGWGVAALWVVNEMLECRTSESWRKMYLKASGLDEVVE